MDGHRKQKERNGAHGCQSFDVIGWFWLHWTVVEVVLMTGENASEDRQSDDPWKEQPEPPTTDRPSNYLQLRSLISQQTLTFSAFSTVQMMIVRAIDDDT